jgi:hypothetical protein
MRSMPQVALGCVTFRLTVASGSTATTPGSAARAAASEAVISAV